MEKVMMRTQLHEDRHDAYLRDLLQRAGLQITPSSPADLDRIREELNEAGLQDRDINVLDGPESDLIADLIKRGFMRNHVYAYARARRLGMAILVAEAADERVDRGEAIMRRYEAWRRVGRSAAETRWGEPARRLREHA